MQMMETATSKVMSELLSVFSQEQLQQLARLSMQSKERAEIRKCEQRLGIHFNAKGKLLHFDCSDNVRAISSDGYWPG